MSVSATISFGQPPPPLPDGYYSQAPIPNPPHYGPYDALFWKYDLSGLEGCKDVRIWTFITVTFHQSGDTRLIIFPLEDLTGDFTVDVPYISTLGQHTGEGFSLTHMAFQLEINGVLNSYIIYPGSSTNLSTGLPPPCDCIAIYFNTNQKTLYLGQGNCN